MCFLAKQCALRITKVRQFLNSFRIDLRFDVAPNSRDISVKLAFRDPILVHQITACAYPHALSGKKIVGSIFGDTI